MSLSKLQQLKLDEELFWKCGVFDCYGDMSSGSLIKRGANPNWKAPPWGELDHNIPYQWRNWFFLRYYDDLLVWNDYCVIKPYYRNWFYYYVDGIPLKMRLNGIYSFDYYSSVMVSEVQRCYKELKENTAPCLIHSPLTLWIGDWRLVSTESEVSIINCYDANIYITLKESTHVFTFHDSEGRVHSIGAESPLCHQLTPHRKTISPKPYEKQLHHGWSCLHMAICSGDCLAVKQLLEDHHVASTMTDDEETPLDIARTRGLTDIMKYLDGSKSCCTAEFVALDEFHRHDEV